MTTTTPSILGQNMPSAGINTNLFTVANGSQVQFNLFVCNQSTSQDQFTIALVPNTGIETAATYIAFNTPIISNGIFTIGGLYLNSGDQIKILSTHGNLSFTATGLIIN
jgi:hypothetical protein